MESQLAGEVNWVAWLFVYLKTRPPVIYLEHDDDKRNKTTSKRLTCRTTSHITASPSLKTSPPTSPPLPPNRPATFLSELNRICEGKPSTATPANEHSSSALTVQTLSRRTHVLTILDFPGDETVDRANIDDAIRLSSSTIAQQNLAVNQLLGTYLAGLPPALSNGPTGYAQKLGSLIRQMERDEVILSFFGSMGSDAGAGVAHRLWTPFGNIVDVMTSTSITTTSGQQQSSRRIAKQNTTVVKALAEMVPDAVAGQTVLHVDT
ncbi:hypothetical protein DFH27DRAFT_651915 [Peziza echinospora]|nr:hypothetical protein DFH27DRAFT_651915 [Peziza echinospora]